MTLRLGKLHILRDSRTFRLERLMKTLPPIPSSFDVYEHLTAGVALDLPMFDNDHLGDCVMAGRAHMTRVFEAFEMQTALKILDQWVDREYFIETHGFDSGLVMLTSMKEWTKRGWLLGGRRYKAGAFASIDTTHWDHAHAAIALLNGVQCGVEMPVSAQNQVGGIWTVTSGADAEPGSWGGHCMYLPSYDLVKDEYSFVTWGARQRATGEWVRKYVSEIYAVADKVDSWDKNPHIDSAQLQAYLKEIGQ